MNKENIIAIICIVGLASIGAWAAQTSLTVENATASGFSMTANVIDLTNGNSFDNDGDTVLIIEELTGTTTGTVYVETGKTLGGYSVADETITIVPGALVIVGPFNPDVFNNSADDVTTSYTQTTSATIGVVRVQ